MEMMQIEYVCDASQRSENSRRMGNAQAYAHPCFSFDRTSNYQARKEYVLLASPSLSLEIQLER